MRPMGYRGKLAERRQPRLLRSTGCPWPRSAPALACPRAARVALYAEEGAKRDGAVKFANTNPRMIAFYCAWLRRFFEIDEARLRVRLSLHEGLDLAASVA